MALLLKNLLFTLVLPGTVAVYVPLWIRRGLEPVEGFGFLLALFAFGLGGGVYAWCVWDFASFGGGTPAPIDAPKRLVVRGLYHYTRNPMYVGVLCVILGWVLLYRATPLLVYALCVATMFQCFIVLYEERHLAREFGAEYAGYRARVGRWLPRLVSGGPPQ